MERESVSVGGEGEKATESKRDVKNAYKLGERGCQRKAERERGEREDCANAVLGDTENFT